MRCPGGGALWATDAQGAPGAKHHEVPRGVPWATEDWSRSGLINSCATRCSPHGLPAQAVPSTVSGAGRDARVRLRTICGVRYRDWTRVRQAAMW
mgnify:CR=1 FL=1